MTPSETLDAESLLRHGAWLAQLARALVARDDEIDDVLQQTWTQALAAPPRRESNLRSWLGAIARNVVRTSRRRDAARAQREEIAPRPAPPETPDELVARAELRRAVVDAVLALAEPYRGAILRRFFEGQEVAAIAQATGSPAATVRTRIRRGVEQVRETLQARAGANRLDASAAQALMFARLQEFARGGGGAGASAGSGATSGAATLAAGGVVMSIAAKLTLAAAVVAAAALTIWVAQGTGMRPARGEVAARSAKPKPAPVDAAAPNLPPPAVAREPEPIAAERAAAPSKRDAAAAPAKLATSGTLRGTVVDDATGEAVAGADVWIVAAKKADGLLDDAPCIAAAAVDDPERARDRFELATTATTAADGSFECDQLSAFSDWRAVAFDESGRCAMSSEFRFDDQHATRDVKLRVIPAVVLKGRVTDADGAPIVGARVSIILRGSKSGMAVRVTESQATPEPGLWNSGPLAARSIDVRVDATGFEPAAGLRHVEVTRGQREVVLDFTLERPTETLAHGPIVAPSGAPIDLRQRLPELFGEATLDEDVRRHLSVQAIDASLAVPEVGSHLPHWNGKSDLVVAGQIVLERDCYAILLPPKFTGALLLIVDSTVAGTARIDGGAAPPPLPFELSGVVPPAPMATLVVGLVDAATGQRVDLHRNEIGVTPAAPQMVSLDVARETDDPSGARVCEVDVRTGRSIVTFERRGFVPQNVDVSVTKASERRVVELPLVRASASIRGHVTVEEVLFEGVAHKPGVFVSVYAASEHGFEEVTTAPVAVNDAGRFEITRLAPREYALVVESYGVVPTVVHARAAETPPELELSLDHGSEVRFHVTRPRPLFGLTDVMWRIVDPQGLPVVNHFHARGQWSVQSDAIHETLDSGHYQIVIWSRGCREATTEFDVPAPGPIEIALERAR